MFASAAGGDALTQDDTGHWGRGVSGGSHHPRPPSFPRPLFLRPRRVSSSWRKFPASVISTRTSRGSDSGARSGSGVRAGWTSEHRGDALEQLESAVERSAGNHLEGDIGISIVDAVAAGDHGANGEDEHAET